MQLGTSASLLEIDPLTLPGKDEWPSYERPVAFEEWRTQKTTEDMKWRKRKDNVAVEKMLPDPS